MYVNLLEDSFEMGNRELRRVRECENMIGDKTELIANLEEERDNWNPNETTMTRAEWKESYTSRIDRHYNELGNLATRVNEAYMDFESVMGYPIDAPLSTVEQFIV